MSTQDADQMTPTGANTGLILLDACCVLNLYGGRCMEQMLSTSQSTFAIAERAADDVLYVRNVFPDGAEERELVDLQPLLAQGLLRILTADHEDETAAYITLATQLDDGEAMTCTDVVGGRHPMRGDTRLAPLVVP